VDQCEGFPCSNLLYVIFFLFLSRKPIALADLKQEGFSSSQSLAIHVASKKFVKDASDDEVLEEEILVEDLTPDKRADELKLEAQRVRQEGLLAEKAAREAEHAERAAREEERRRRQQEEEEERRKREEAAKETEEQRLARVLAETTKLREQEQLQLQVRKVFFFFSVFFFFFFFFPFRRN
jgi:septal ring factor EnvC (AmiA/AmiB activator)